MSIFINKSLVSHDGIQVFHHKLSAAELSVDGDALNIRIDSWVSEASRLDGAPPVSKSAQRTPITSLLTSSKLLSDIGVALTASGTMAGGSVVPGSDGTLSDSKRRAWDHIKAQRTTAIAAQMVTPFGTFDCNPASASSIAAAAQLASAKIQLGLPGNIDFTLADNTTVNLTPEQMIQVGLLLGAQVQAAFKVSRLIRVEIETATSVEQLDLISWPS